MSRSVNQKLKLLYLWRILIEQSDEQHPVTLQNLIGELAEREIESERKSLYRDLDALRAFGLDIQTVRKGKQTWYYVGERTFAVSELKMLVEGVLTSRYLTEKKTGELIGKLSTLCGAVEEQLEKRKVYVPDRITSMDESLYQSIDCIHGAIASDTRLCFGYVTYTVDKQRTLRRNGAAYCVSPFAVVWDDAHYYMLAYDGDAGILKHFRVDKMEAIQPDPQPREGKDCFAALDMAAYAKKSFHMFGGQEREVTLRFSNHLAGAVIDRFGKDVEITPTGEDRFTITVPVAVSPQFFGWVCGFAGEAEIVSPDDVRQMLRVQLETLQAAHRA